MAISRADDIICVASTPALRVGEGTCPPKVPQHSQPRQGKDGWVGTEGVTKSPVLGTREEVDHVCELKLQAPSTCFIFPIRLYLQDTDSRIKLRLSRQQLQSIKFHVQGPSECAVQETHSVWVGLLEPKVS